MPRKSPSSTPTPREERAAARDQRQHLQLPQHGLGRAELIRSRSPSPVAPGVFNFPQPVLHPQNGQEEDQFEDTTNNMAADQATIQALTEALQGMKASSRKPELPAFDPKNIDIWIKRVDNAYRRAGITDPKDKFAHIESKFEVDADPRIQSYIFGDGTAEEWDELMEYLKGRYGKTKSQRASFILDGVKRDGRLPSEMFAFVKDKIGDLTVDDIIREMVLRELPVDIQRTIHDQAKALDGTETSKLADSFFDKDGRPLHKPTASAINNVEQCPGLVDTEDENDDVNAVGFNKARSRKFRPNGQQNRNFNSKTPWAQKQNNGASAPSGNQQQKKPSFTPAFGEKKEHRGPPTVKNVKLCRYHQQFGDNARTCESSCVMFSKWSGNGKAGRQT